MSRKKKVDAPPPSERATLESPPPATDTIAPPQEAVDDPHPTEAGGMPSATAWDEQPTVDLTGTDLAPITREDAQPASEEHPSQELAPQDAPESPSSQELLVVDDLPQEQAAQDAEDEEAGVEQARELSRAHLRGLLEALVFASDKPMKSNELARLASAPVKQVKELLAELKEAHAGRGVVLDEVAGGWLFRTSVQYAPFVRELTSEKPVRLSRAQIETLAIAAYRQPITRPEIDDIRGVDSGATLKLLLERDLVRILGKKDEPGRPLLYGTTTHFLEFFGLKSLKDLPTLKEFTELNEESRRVAEAELGDVLPETVAAKPGDEADATPQVEADLRVDGDTLAPPTPPDHDTIAPPAPSTQDESEVVPGLDVEAQADVEADVEAQVEAHAEPHAEVEDAG